MWIPAILHGIALFIALQVQTIATPFAGAWLFFFLAGIAMMVKDGYILYSPLYKMCAVWLLWIGLSCFIVHPVVGGAAIMWMLAAMPVLALCVKPAQLHKHFVCFSVVLGLYAANLILQQLVDAQFTDTENVRRSWPVMDANNAACILNAGVIAFFYLSFKRRYLLPILALFVAALLLTYSRAGVIAAVIGCLYVVGCQFKRVYTLAAILGAMLGLCVVTYYYPDFVDNGLHSFADRYPIWAQSWQLLEISPNIGLGLGTFASYYAQVRTEHFSGGWFAHNDILQFAVELGMPAALLFCAIMLYAINAGRRAPVAGGYLVCVLLQAMVEFQYYTPAISLLTGLAVAYCGVASMRGPDEPTAAFIVA